MKKILLSVMILGFMMMFVACSSPSIVRRIDKSTVNYAWVNKNETLALLKDQAPQAWIDGKFKAIKELDYDLTSEGSKLFKHRKINLIEYHNYLFDKNEKKEAYNEDMRFFIEPFAKHDTQIYTIETSYLDGNIVYSNKDKELSSNGKLEKFDLIIALVTGDLHISKDYENLLIQNICYNTKSSKEIRGRYLYKVYYGSLMRANFGTKHLSSKGSYKDNDLEIKGNITVDNIKGGVLIISGGKYVKLKKDDNKEYKGWSLKKIVEMINIKDTEKLTSHIHNSSTQDAIAFEYRDVYNITCGE